MPIYFKGNIKRDSIIEEYLVIGFPNNVSTPYHLIDLDKLEENLSILAFLKQRANCKILYALKCFPNDLLFPYINKVLDGVCASGLYEARLGKERFSKEVHTFSTAFSQSNIDEISKYSDFITFNSTKQWNRFKNISMKYKCAVGLRINPDYSEIANYNTNPCHEYTRFGLASSDLHKINIEHLDFILVHNMCEQLSDTFERSIKVITGRLHEYLKSIKHINLGGGQLFTHKDYKIEEAVSLIRNIQEKYQTLVYIEPGEAIIYNSSYLVTSIVDIVDNGIKTAILDASAVCHMPDVIFSNYKCEVIGGFPEMETMHTYRLAGSSCYAGDIFGNFSFLEPLQVGQKITIKDSLNYTSVKSNMFNGIGYPSLVFYSFSAGYKLAKNYNYNTYLSII